jgi:lysophospholipase L1-like esterase
VQNQQVTYLVGMFRGFEKPPWWATVIIVGGSLALLIGVPYTINRKPVDPLSKSELARMEAAAKAADESAEAARPRRVAFLGDSYTVGEVADPGHGYVDVTCADLQLQCVGFGQGGTGYTNPGESAGEAVFLDRVPDVAAAAPDVVVVEGSINDGGNAAVRPAAVAVFQALREQLPGAVVVALGPVNTPVDADEEVARRNVQAAATDAGVMFIDAFDWVPVNDATLWEGIHPTTAGHALIAQQLEPVLRDQVLVQISSPSRPAGR